MAESRSVVLVVDDELSIRESFSLILGKEYKVVTAASGEAALKRIIDEKIDLVYLDVRMPGLNGIETLKRIKEIDRGVEVVMVTAVNDVTSAGSAIKLGARDYVIKPFDVQDILNKTKSIALKARTRQLKMAGREELVGNSKQILNVRKAVDQLSHAESHILIIAEKGLEGELLAETISAESDKKLVNIEIGRDFSISTLFGREKGSFTEEFRKEIGVLEAANGGILFIRNIELMPKEAQLRLAEALTKNEIHREGSLSPIHVSVRIIAEASIDPKKTEDLDPTLYKLIGQSVIDLPPVRQRESDIPVLIDHFLDKFQTAYNRKVRISPEAMEVLSGYRWPGNTAEMSNTVESLVLGYNKGTIDAGDLPLDILMKSSSGGRPHTTLENLEGKLEAEHILYIYNKAGHNKEKAAAMLGMQTKTLESKLESMNA